MKILLTILFLSCAVLAQVPERLCVVSERGRIEIDTRNSVFQAQFNGQSYTGPFQVLLSEPSLFYLAGIGSAPGLTFYTNATWKRFSSFADVRLGSSFRMWNDDHLDCDGNPSTASPYEVAITGATIGSAPFRTTLTAVPSDFETLTTYAWCVNDKMVAVGQSLTIEVSGKVVVEVEAIYNDIRARTEVVVEGTRWIAIDEPPIFRVIKLRKQETGHIH